MLRKAKIQVGLGLLCAAACAVFVVGGLASCAPTAFPVSGQDPVDNTPPTIEITQPIADIVVGQNDPFNPLTIRWNDSDPDDNAQVSLQLISINNSGSQPVTRITLLDVEEDSSTDKHTANTAVPIADYNLKATIYDGVNPKVETYAIVGGGTTGQRVVVSIVDPAVIPPTIPPTVTVTEPVINRSVAPGDLMRIVVQPTAFPPSADSPFDGDSDVRLFVLLDVDNISTNDDPEDGTCYGGVLDGNGCTLDQDCGSGMCVHEGIIVLEDTKEPTILAGAFDSQIFQSSIDVEKILQVETMQGRPPGEPYRVRATVDDLRNPPAHSYAPATINVVELAASDNDQGEIDLYDIGRTKAGVRFQGFNAGARLGSDVDGVSDFDGIATDGESIDDFIMVAQFGNPQNLGQIGEAYLVYGRSDMRFGGTISVNSISDTISGAVFQAPPVRDARIPDANAYTAGITDVGWIPDLTGDGKPELLFGLPHVHGAYSSQDYDLSDTDAQAGGGRGCYPDSLVNNLSNPEPDRGVPDIDAWFAGGMAIVFNSSNRDSIGPVDPRRLDSTSAPLEFTGQLALNDEGLLIALDGSGFSAFDDTNAAHIVNRTSNQFADNVGNDPNEPSRTAGVRFMAGGFDAIDAFGLRQPARAGLFGYNVASIGDLDADNVPEFIFSAPNNEAYYNALASDPFANLTHLASTVWRHNVVIIPGDNYNGADWRGRGDSRTSAQPSFDSRGESACSATDPVGRSLDHPPDTFEIISENANDRLGDGQSAGDFNDDGVDDVLCGAPLNDKSASEVDFGATYIIFGRPLFGDVDLRDADDPDLRAPMLRIRGLKTADRIGWAQAGNLDFNGDGRHDVVIASPYTDFGGVTGECRSDRNGDGITDAGDYELAEFEECINTSGDEVFVGESCKDFDFDNDRDIDEDDRCIFCCLSGDCTPDPSCVLGQGGEETCCDNLVDNGFVGVIFGGNSIGDRDLSQLATSQLPGVCFYGGQAGDRAGYSVSSAGDFNWDGFSDILITAPGRIVTDDAGRDRLGVVYLIFGGPESTFNPGSPQIQDCWNLDDIGRINELPGIKFFSPYVAGRPNEAAPTAVGLVGDINKDGFDDIAIGNERADYIDPSFPQGPDAPGTDPATGRVSDVGDVYVIYGNRFGRNGTGGP